MMFEMSQFKKWPRTTKEYLYRDFFLSFGAIKEVFYSHQTKKRRFKKFVIFQFPENFSNRIVEPLFSKYIAFSFPCRAY